jgi:hypothetical protein
VRNDGISNLHPCPYPKRKGSQRPPFPNTTTPYLRQILSCQLPGGLNDRVSSGNTSPVPFSSLLLFSLPSLNASGTFSLRLMATKLLGSLTLDSMLATHSTLRLDSGHHSRVELCAECLQDFFPVVVGCETATRREADHMTRVELSVPRLVHLSLTTCF